jgi:hypothetical protein
MKSVKLAELLTGEALGIPEERLDMQGMVAAFRCYKDASADTRRQMQIDLAEAILKFDDWGLIADAIYLARSLNMTHDKLRTAIKSATLMAPEEYRDTISTEARRYFRDVLQKQSSIES